MLQEVQETTRPANIGNGIVIKQKVRFGKPCIRGTRIAVADILHLLRAGYRVSEIPAQYPGIAENDIEAALNYTARILGKEELLEIEPA